MVPNINLSADSSHKNAALSPVDPLSIIKPESFAFEEAPLFKPIMLSDKSKFWELTVVVVPVTVRLPVTVTLPVNEDDWLLSNTSILVIVPAWSVANSILLG